MGNCVTPEIAYDIFSRFQNQIIGDVGVALVLGVPYLDAIDGGTLDNNMGRQFRSVIQNNTVPGFSLTKPVFVDSDDACNAAVNVDKTGTKEFTFKPQIYDGETEQICVFDARSAYEDNFERIVESYKENIVQLQNSDIRATLLELSGVKVVVRTGSSLASMLTESAISATFKAQKPNAGLTWALLQEIMNYQTDVNRVPEIGNLATDATFTLYTNRATHNALRNEAGFRDDFRAIVQNPKGYQIGTQALAGYAYDNFPYRGVKIALDPTPLRYNELDGDGQPIFIEPYQSQSTTVGVEPVMTEAYKNASYTISFLTARHRGKSPIKRLVPARYTGNGMFKFNTQIANGDLEWYNQKTDCNKRGRFGQMLYSVERAYKPEYPKFIVAIAHARCNVDLGLTACSYYGSTGVAVLP